LHCCSCCGAESEAHDAKLPYPVGWHAARYAPFACASEVYQGGKSRYEEGHETAHFPRISETETFRDEVSNHQADGHLQEAHDQTQSHDKTFNATPISPEAR
jgi:hypothetical protein